VPPFSICTPVHDPPLDLLGRCLASVRGQTFPDWELCLVDDGSQDRAVLDLLRRTATEDPRVRLVERPSSGGIVAASNDALALARGEFVVLVDHDDWIERDALAVIDAALRQAPEVDYLYTDEDKWHEGSHFDPFLKPSWSPERLRSQNYCTHLSVLRRSLVAEVGGFRPGFDGSQDHDLILRVTERARRVLHVPQVLYHWCVSPASAAGRADAKPAAREAGRRAVADHAARIGIDAEVEHLSTPGHFRVRRRRPEPAPLVSAIIATAGTARPVWSIERPLVLGAVHSLLEVTSYPNLEVVVVLDPRTPPGVVEELEQLDVRLLRSDGPFNYAQRYNEGVAASSGDLVLHLNDDTLVEEPDWLDVMVGFLEEPDVGVVGARLLYSDGRLQHGGILLNGNPLHIFHGFSGDHPGPFGLLQIDREVSAVTGACLLTRRELYDELGGLDEAFAVAFNDVDYCLRVRARGLRVVWTAHATLYHLESQTRSPDAEQHEIDLLYARWATELADDPYGNPHFAPKQGVWRPRLRDRLDLALRPLGERFRVAPPARARGALSPR
jgi:O-antigen biosynthesis protein